MADEITSPAPAYIPPAVISFLGSKKSVNTNLELVKKYKLQDKDLSFIIELIWDVVGKKKRAKDLLIEIKTHFSRWPEDQVRSLALDILGRQLLPISNIIPGVEQEIKDLGGKIEDYPKEKIVPPAVSIPELTDTMIKDLQIQLPDKFLKHRLENIVTSKIKGVRDDFETKNRLIRGAKIGGLDIPPTQADQIISYIDSAKDTVRIIEKAEEPHPPAEIPEEEGAPKTEAEPEISEVAAKKEAGKSEAFTVRPEDIEEIKAERMRGISDAVLNEYARVEQEIIKESGYSFSDPDMQNRFEKAISARVRDVRDELETKNLFTRGPKEGGLGLPKERAEALIALINKKIGPLKDRLEKIEMEHKEEQLQKVERIQDISKQKEQEELDRRFAKLTGRTPTALPEEEKKKAEVGLPLKEEIIKPPVVPKPPVPPAPKPSAPAPKPPTVEKAAAPKPTEKEAVTKPAPAEAPKIAPPPPATAVPITAKPEAPRPPTPKPPEPAVQTVAPAPKPVPEAPRPKVRVSPPSIPSKPEKRPKVEEIKYAKRLFGPIEELREMKLEDFRRLSKDPAERAIKIKDKIDLLGEESFDKMMKGIAAWQESPAHKHYLNLIQDAFQTGKNVQTIIQERESQGRPTLTWEEFQSIIELNQKIKQ